MAGECNRKKYSPVQSIGMAEYLYFEGASFRSFLARHEFVEIEESTLQHVLIQTLQSVELGADVKSFVCA